MALKTHHMVGLHRYHTQDSRKNRPRRQRDGETIHDRAFENASRREINDFHNRLQEIRDREQKTPWAQEGSGGQKKFVLSSRNVKFNHYGAIKR